jgi:hypothetical protein
VVDKIDEWLGHEKADNDHIGLPPVLKTSIARSSAEVYLLLMWLARRALQQPSAGETSEASKEDLRKRIAGVATTLHWLGEAKGRAVQEIAKEAHVKPIESPAFKNILNKAYRVDGRTGLYRPPSLEELKKLIGMPDRNTFRDWRWYNLGRPDHLDWPLVRCITEQRELLLYAQRDYLRRKFRDYDPARTAMWEQHDRPWDFDHILPSATTYYHRDLPNKVALNQWINCIANLRACPMEENRSDQATLPGEKLSQHDKLAESFIEEEEIKGFERGAQKISDTEEALAFIQAAKRRLMRIYRE